MVIHYQPYIDYEDEPHPFCNVRCAETSDVSNDWDDVSCKKCLRLKESAKQFVEQVESHILDDMASFNKFMKNENQSNLSKEP